jgi:hypothetical protein
MKSFLLPALLLLTATAAGALTPSLLGPDFQVNTTTAGSQDYADVAGLSGGGFVAVWSDQSPTSATGVKLRLFRASGAPASGEIVISSEGTEPQVAGMPGGGFAVVWTDFHFALHLRIFDAQGVPAGGVVTYEPYGAQPDVAADGAGNLAVVWRRQGTMTYVQRFGPDGHSLGPATSLSDGPFDILPRVAANASGDLLVTWTDRDLAAKARRYESGTGAWTPVIDLPTGATAFHHATEPVLYPSGEGAVLLNEDQEIVVARLNASGVPVGGVLPVASGAYEGNSPDVAVDSKGNALVAWTSQPDDGLLYESRVHLRLFDASWQPLGEPFVVRPDPLLSDAAPALATLASDAFAVVWVNGDYFWRDLPITPPPPRDGEDGDDLGIFGQVVAPARCAVGSEVLCLGLDGRFEARVTWKTPAGLTGIGRARPLTADTGALWFVDGDNLELMVKVLDAGIVNGKYWVFYGSLSNLEYTLTVKDTVTGEVKTYHNAQRQLASRADVNAFPWLQVVPASAPLPAPVPPAAAGNELSLAGDRFKVEVEFTDPRTDRVGQGQAVPLTGDTGAFWFFDAANLELMIKVLDGRQVNGHFWVFFGALSDVDYTITVTDSLTGAHQTYHNDRHTLASRADVKAF